MKGTAAKVLCDQKRRTNKGLAALRGSMTLTKGSSAQGIVLPRNGNKENFGVFSIRRLRRVQRYCAEDHPFWQCANMITEVSRISFELNIRDNIGNTIRQSNTRICTWQLTRR